jgi:hypothetical protein
MSPLNAITPNNSEKFTRPRVLLVEPDLDVLADRTLLLSRSKYTVAPASSYREIFGLRSEQLHLFPPESKTANIGWRNSNHCGCLSSDALEINNLTIRPASAPNELAEITTLRAGRAAPRRSAAARQAQHTLCC